MVGTAKIVGPSWTLSPLTFVEAVVNFYDVGDLEVPSVSPGMTAVRCLIPDGQCPDDLMQRMLTSTACTACTRMQCTPTAAPTAAATAAPTAASIAALNNDRVAVAKHPRPDHIMNVKTAV